MQTYAPPTLNLSSLIGVSLADAGCLLNVAQITCLGSLLIEHRPTDPQTISLLGGALDRLAHNAGRDTPPLISVASMFGDDPFLVIVGPQGALTLLATAERDGYRVWLLSDPEIADRVALILSQFGDVHYTLEAICDQERQSAFIATIIAALLAEPSLRAADLAALVPHEPHSLALAQALASHSDPTTCLSLAAVRATLQTAGRVRVVLGQFDDDQTQLLVLASEGGSAPQSLPVPATLLATIVRDRRPASAAPNQRSAGDDWTTSGALYAAPLLRDGQVWGALLVASDRALSIAARASLHGLSAALSATLRPAPRAVAPAPLAAPARRPGRTFAPPARPAPVTTSAAPAAPRTPTAAPASRAQQTLAAQFALLNHLHDGVLLTDARGRIVAATDTAIKAFKLASPVAGKALVESGAWGLAMLLTDAVMGELEGPRAIELPDGTAASATVVELGPEAWAFVLHPSAGAAPSSGTRNDAAASNGVAASNGADRGEHFLMNFSNIVRSPLQALRDLIMQVSAAGQLNEQQAQLIGQVVKLNSELSMLMNDLLALGQIRLQSPEQNAPLRLDLLVEAAVGTQYAEFGRRGQQVTTQITPNLPRVHADEEGLGRAIAALVDNAIKYSPTGARIGVNIHAQDNQIVVVVEDSGAGLTPDELALVFDPFYRAPKVVQAGIPGRGLGLTIAKMVIEQHRGRIWAASTPGQGSSFAFSLPVLPPVSAG